MLNTFYRLISLSIYPLILLLCAWLILRKNKYRQTVKENYKQIIINTFIISLIILTGIVIFFNIENTIYVYDYAGHWKRALELRSTFSNNPSSILSHVYKSINYDDYSLLPALFGLWSTLINKGMGFFVISSYINFLLPFIVCIQVLYYSYIKNHKWLPMFIILSCYPIYINLFFCKIDMGSLLFILIAIMLIIIPKFDEIDNIDNISINLLTFISIFFRRWYLYPVVMVYLCYFIKYLIYYHKSVFSKESLIGLTKIILSGLLLLIVVIIFFNPFFTSVLTNNFSEAYAIYDHEGKLFDYFNVISPLVIITSIIGLYYLFKVNKELAFELVLMSIIPAILISKIQAMEYHHYYSVIISIVILYSYGLVNIFNIKFVKYAICTIGLAQALVIFFGNNSTMPFLTNIRKKPEIIAYKQDIVDLADYLRIQAEGFRNIYLASGNYVFNDDGLRNSFLPELEDIPNICFATLDLRDGFPENFGNIDLIVVNDPILYTNENYQHIYHLISKAVTSHPIISKIYTPIKTQMVDEISVTVYEKTGEYTPEMKQYFYDQMISYYPNKEEYFKYILN